jgi:hypothetical protein
MMQPEALTRVAAMMLVKNRECTVMVSSLWVLRPETESAS